MFKWGPEFGVKELLIEVTWQGTGQELELQELGCQQYLGTQPPTNLQEE